MSKEKQTKKILIIEDEKMLAEMYRDRFIHEGYEVYSSYDAEEGMQMTLKIKPDLIILDILLPRANGTEFLEKKEKINEVRNIPVIAYSNYDDNTYKEKAKKLGVKEYLIKTNYTPKEISDIVKKHISG